MASAIDQHDECLNYIRILMVTIAVNSDVLEIPICEKVRGSRSWARLIAVASS